MEKVRVSCVAYLNSKPFLFGLNNHPIRDSIELTLDHPKDCATKLINNQADLGLVPVASLLQIPDYRIIGESCIGADGAVASVMLFSRVPLAEITEILLDYQSMTSVNLCKLLCKDYWNIHPAFKNASPGYESRISGTIAGVVIGDRALEMDGDFQYRYDLAAAWKAWTGLPFVFACWVSNKPLEDSFVKSFNEALEQGVQRMDEVIRQIRSSGSNLSEQVEQYYKQNLCFHMQDQHRQGLQLFLNKLATI